MLAGLRKLEEEAADEDLEALREMEAEEAGVPKPKAANSGSKAAPKTVENMPPEILVHDSQNGLLKLGGFDDEAMLDSEPEEEKGRDGQPLKVYKKKGQKRTTRRVIMKPVRSKPQPQNPAPDEDIDELAHQDHDTVPETQMGDTAGFGDARNFDSDSQSEYTASEGGTRYRRPNQKKDRRANEGGRIKTAARKVSAMANQNFKRLKLRNSGAKGGPAHNSRFRRKR
jgi:DNA replication regulator SLD2